MCGTIWRVGLGKENREHGHAKIICDNVWKKTKITLSFRSNPSFSSLVFCVCSSWLLFVFISFLLFFAMCSPFYIDFLFTDYFLESSAFFELCMYLSLDNNRHKINIMFLIVYLLALLTSKLSWQSTIACSCPRIMSLSLWDNFVTSYSKILAKSCELWSNIAPKI